MILSDSTFFQRLDRPDLPVDVVIDTDTYNEIDDQFALAYLIKQEKKLNLKAIYAAPFQNRKSNRPGEGMELSFNEIMRVLDLMGREDLRAIVHKGADSFLPSETEPVRSRAAEHLAALAMEYSPEKPLYVIAIAAITNVASAMLVNPAIRDRIVVVWLGGNALEWPHNWEFNLQEDVAAARVVLDSGAAVVLLPCMGVVSAFTTSGPELEHWLRGKNALCDYLVDAAIEEARFWESGPCWTRTIWDVAAVGWLLGESFMEDRLEHSPVPAYDNRWSVDKRRHFIRYVYHINRDLLFEDLFTALAQ